MKQEDFQVVAELYRFLASFDQAAISAASKLPSISENLRRALTALHQEATSQRAGSASQATSANSSTKRKNGGSLDPLGLLTDKKKFSSKRELYELAKLLGIKIKEDAKDSRDRAARRIANAVIDDPDACEKLYDLMGAAKDTQTAGWFELIRRGT